MSRAWSRVPLMRVAAPCAVVVVAHVALREWHWRLSWAMTVEAYAFVGIFFGPVLAMCAYFVANAWWPSRELAQSRSVDGGLRLRVARGVLVQGLGVWLLGAVGVGLVTSLGEATWNGTDVLGVSWTRGSALLGTVLWGVVGLVFGFALRPRNVGLLVGLAVFGLIFGAYTAFSDTYAVAGGTGGVFTDVYDRGYLRAQTIGLLGLVILAALALIWGRRAAVPVLVLALALGAAFGARNRTFRPGPVPPCAGDPPVCTPLESTREELAEQARPGLELLRAAGTDPPRRISVAGEYRRDEFSVSSTWLFYDSATRRSLVASAVGQYVEAAGCPPDFDLPFMQYDPVNYKLLDTVAAAYGNTDSDGDPVVGEAEAAQLLRDWPATFRAWSAACHALG